MYPTLIDFGPFGIHSYGLMLATAFITVVIILQYELKRKGFAAELASSIVMAAAIGGIVGAKLYSAFQDGHLGFRELFSTTGLVWYGGLIGGCATVSLVILRSPNPYLPTIDAIGPTLLLGYGIGRIGCLLAGDGDYGPPSELPWAMAFPNGTVPTDVPVHPTPIYETLISFTFFGILWAQRRKFEAIPGTLFGASLCLIGLERFVVEFWRINRRVLVGLSEAQLFSIALFIFGIFFLFWMRNRSRAEATESSTTAPAKQAPHSKKRRQRR